VYTHVHTHDIHTGGVPHTHRCTYMRVYMYVHTVTQGTVGIKFKIVDTDTRSVVTTVQVACNVHTRFSSHTSQCYVHIKYIIIYIHECTATCSYM
jgi:hypothetical protein